MSAEKYGVSGKNITVSYYDTEKQYINGITDLDEAKDVATKVVEDTKKATKEIDIRVISMPSIELFEKQENEYIEKVLPSTCLNRIAVEAGSTRGWYKYVGLKGKGIEDVHSYRKGDMYIIINVTINR